MNANENMETAPADDRSCSMDEVLGLSATPSSTTSRPHTHAYTHARDWRFCLLFAEFTYSPLTHVRCFPSRHGALVGAQPGRCFTHYLFGAQPGRCFTPSTASHTSPPRRQSSPERQVRLHAQDAVVGREHERREHHVLHVVPRSVHVRMAIREAAGHNKTGARGTRSPARTS